MDRSRWIMAVNHCMKRDWCIDTADAGLDERDLDSHWRDGETPAAFVAWFAEKYDLIPFEPMSVRRSLSTPRRSA